MSTIEAEPMQAGRLRARTPISKLVAQVYDAAPMAERGPLLEHLLKPLGLLSLAVVAKGIFPYMTFSNGPRFLSIRPEQVQNVRPEDVIALADYVQQVSIESVESLLQRFTSVR